LTARVPCASCPFWAKGCRLMLEGRLAELLDRGACRPTEWIASWIQRLLQNTAPHWSLDSEDLLQEMQVYLREGGLKLPEDLPPDAKHLRRYLRSAVLNRISDLLRHQKVIPKVRCGACLYRGARGTCMKATTVDGAGGIKPHPHYGRAVDPGASPASLDPPCSEFFWRYRPLRLDEIAEIKKSEAAPDDQGTQELKSILAAALEELASGGAARFRQAYFLKKYFLDGRPATELAREAGLNERTVRRHIAAGLGALRRILEEKYGVKPEDLD